MKALTWARAAGCAAIFLLAGSVLRAQSSQLTSPTPGSNLGAGAVTFTWEDVGSENYILYVGTTQAGNDLQVVSPGTATSAEVSGLPTDVEIWVRLWTKLQDDSNRYYVADYAFNLDIDGDGVANALDPTPTEAEPFVVIDDGDYRLRFNGSGRVVELQLPTAVHDDIYANGFYNEYRNLTARVLTHLRDDYDFILFTNEGGSASTVTYAGIHFSVQNDVTGIGTTSFDNSALFGSAGRLQSVIHFPSFNGVSGGPSLHEIAHRWANRIIPTQVSGHWGYSGVGGQLGGWAPASLEDRGGGNYHAVSLRDGATSWGSFANGGNALGYAPLELYLMGLAPASEVPVTRVAQDFAFGSAAGEFTASGFDDWSIERIVTEKGARTPAYGDAPTSFNVLFVLLTPTPLEAGRIAEFDEDVYQFTLAGDDGTSSFNFWEATNGRGTLVLGDARTALLANPNLAAPALGAFSGFVADGFEVNWTQATDAVNYRLDVSTASDFSSFITGYEALTTGDVSTATVSGLAAGTTYYVRLRSVDTNGAFSAYSETGTVNTLPALSPATASLTADAQTYALSVTSQLAWTVQDAPSWLALNPSSGTGPGDITVTVEANPTLNERVGSILVSGQSHSVTQAGATPVAPVITTQPQNWTTSAGTNGGFLVVATGFPAPTYLWFKDDQLIEGATASTLLFSDVTLADAGTYRVVVGNAGGMARSDAALLDVTFPPEITTSPVKVTAFAGGSASLSVVAAGNPSPTYRWTKNGEDIVGATSATLSFSALQVSDSADYHVYVTNSEGTRSAFARVNVLAATASHALDSIGYVAGSTITISNTLSMDPFINDLTWSVMPPAGWSFVSSAGDGASVAPTADATGLLEWTWVDGLNDTLAFSYTLNVPEGASGTQSLSALLEISYLGASLEMLPTPEPLSLRVRPATHSADYNQDLAIGLSELLRVIELYNTRDGTTRTGSYAVGAGTVDGYIPSPTPNTSADHRHSADTDGDGRLGLTELLRVIELYNTRTGTTRTGAYRVDAGTVDGFAPDTGD